MGKVKGIFKGIKCISQLFVVKEREMEIGNPTDVVHVGHIGCDSTSETNAPSWMNEFRTASDISSASLSNFEVQSREASWISQDFDQPRGLQQTSGVFTDSTCPEISKARKKTRRKKPKASSPSSSRPPRSRASSQAAATEEADEAINC